MLTFVVSSRKPHLGGNILEGDPATDYPELYRYLVDRFKIRSVLDVGCGCGHALKRFHALGCWVLGVDGLEFNAKKSSHPVLVHDLTEGPVIIPGVQLVWCCEVAEHIEARFVDNLLGTLANGEVIAMTAAPPGQGGQHHVNCQPNSYWIAKLAAYGYEFMADVTAETKKLARDHWGRTGMVFQRRSQNV